jgi:hypothetical protein
MQWNLIPNSVELHKFDRIMKYLSYKIGIPPLHSPWTECLSVIQEHLTVAYCWQSCTCYHQQFLQYKVSCSLPKFFTCVRRITWIGMWPMVFGDTCKELFLKSMCWWRGLNPWLPSPEKIGMRELLTCIHHIGALTIHSFMQLLQVCWSQ